VSEAAEDSWFDSKKGREILFFKTPDCFWDLPRLLYSVGRRESFPMGTAYGSWIWPLI